MIKNLLWVGLGGGLGSMARYYVSWLSLKFVSLQFPLPTFLVNILGSLAIGYIIGTYTSAENESLKLFLAVGFCGGFTTFSSFSLENLKLLENGQTLLALIYILSSLILGLAAVALGFYLSKNL